MEQENYGLLPDVWGPHAWELLHSIAHAYPLSPTDEEKQHYKEFFRLFQYTIPCPGCKKSYSEFISDNKEGLLLDDKVVENRNTLTLWMFNLHQRVNKKLGKTYNITYEEVCKKYDGYRIKDNMNLEDKAKCYMWECTKEVPYLEFTKAEYFIDYATKRGLTDFKKNINKFKSLSKYSNEWRDRTTKCWEIINNMKLNAISNLEKTGEYMGLPTIEELKLMENLSTTVKLDKLERIIEKIKNKDTSFSPPDIDGGCNVCRAEEPQPTNLDKPKKTGKKRYYLKQN